MGSVELTLVVSGLVGAGSLECDVDVSVLFIDGTKASKFLASYISLVLFTCCHICMTIRTLSLH